ncbi:MAG TPA: 5-formyltetrahydrofolate cyclo-ligase [Clostridia bacterium]|nr:5-formyltetrahydrofolate cyclo-ligase [Clostridia bacterium]
MKEAIRKQILEIRNKLSDDEVYHFSQSIFSHLKENSFFNTSAHVMIYLDFKHEVKTDPIIDYCLMHNKKVYIPVCIPETHELCISRITSLKELKEGHFGIREPRAEYIRLSDSSLIDLVLVPGVAFDNSGNRIGFGAGYYDRFMKRLQPDAVKAALAYSFQIVDHVPSDEFDIAADYVITEKSTINCIHN